MASLREYLVNLMDRNELNKYYTTHVGLVHYAARKGYGRLVAMGAPVDYDDLVQELSVVFVKAFDGFSEECGYKFSSYYTRAAYNQINKIAEKVKEERVDNGVRSVEEMAHRYSSATGTDIDDFDILTCSRQTPESELSTSQSLSRMLSNLSPLASLIARWLIDPPKELEREFEACVAHVGLTRQAGQQKRARQTIDMSFICNFLVLLGVSEASVSKARFELKKSAIRGIK
jgi:RNA polymerase sigma factor (sigma-70 family)